MKQLTIDPGTALSPIRHRSQPAGSLPDAKETKLHPRNAGGENASLLFIGTATTILYVSSATRRARRQSDWFFVKRMGGNQTNDRPGKCSLILTVVVANRQQNFLHGAVLPYN